MGLSTALFFWHLFIFFQNQKICHSEFISESTSCYAELTYKSQIF